MFEDTKKELLKAKHYILPALSYAVFSLTVGYLFKDFLGNLSFVVFSIFLPYCFGIIDYFSKGAILKTFRKEWSEAKIIFHFLIILNCFIYIFLYNLIKPLFSNIWPNKTPNK